MRKPHPPALSPTSECDLDLAPHLFRHALTQSEELASALGGQVLFNMFNIFADLINSVLHFTPLRK